MLNQCHMCQLCSATCTISPLLTQTHTAPDFSTSSCCHTTQQVQLILTILALCVAKLHQICQSLLLTPSLNPCVHLTSTVPHSHPPNTTQNPAQPPASPDLSDEDLLSALSKCMPGAAAGPFADSADLLLKAHGMCSF